MSIDLGYSYTMPVDKEKGDIVWDAWEDFMTRMAQHSHNGSDSVDLSPTAEKVEVVLDSLAFDSSPGNGYYLVALALTDAISTTQSAITLFAKITGESRFHQFHPTIESSDEHNLTIKVNRNDISEIKIVGI